MPLRVGRLKLAFGPAHRPSATWCRLVQLWRCVMRVMRQVLGGLRRLGLARRCCERLFNATTAGRLLEAGLAWRSCVRQLETMAAWRFLAAGFAWRSCERLFDALAAGWSPGWAQAVAFGLMHHVARPANAARGSEPCVDGSSPRLGPEPPPQPRMHRWLVPSTGPGALRASQTLARPVTGPGAGRIGSSRHPGPEPYRPQWPVTVPLLRARSRVDRLGSSRHPGPQPPRPL